MLCPVCGSKDTYVIFVESLPCGHCGEMTDYDHGICKDCGNMWRALGDEVLNCTSEFTDEVVDEEELMKLLSDELGKDFDAVQVIEVNNKGTMDELVHRCLRCGAISYEIKPKFYHCPSCSFEWEVI